MDEATDFHTFELRGWQAAATAYENSFAGVAALFAAPLLDAVLTDNNLDCLDLACGTGTLSRLAADHGVRVTGVDFCHEMLSHARRRSPDITFVEASADNLPFDESVFDVAVINFGVNHFSVPVAALSEVQRVVKPTGKAAFTVWSEPHVNIAWRLVFEAIQAAGNTSVALPTPPDGSVNQIDTCRQLVDRSGLDVQTCEIKTIHRLWHMTSADTLMNVLSQGTVRMAALLNAQDTRARLAIKQHISDHLVEYQSDDGYRVPVAAYLTTANNQ